MNFGDICYIALSDFFWVPLQGLIQNGKGWGVRRRATKMRERIPCGFICPFAHPQSRQNAWESQADETAWSIDIMGTQPPSFCFLHKDWNIETDEAKVLCGCAECLLLTTTASAHLECGMVNGGVGGQSLCIGTFKPQQNTNFSPDLRDPNDLVWLLVNLVREPLLLFQNNTN